MIQVNTLVCYDETKNGVIVDPGMSSKREEDMLVDFISKEEILVKYIINTHPHIDHVAGNSFCKTIFDAPLVAHHAGMEIYKMATNHAKLYGFQSTNFPDPDLFVNDNDEICFGSHIWQVIYTPGHADGSICLYDKNNKFVIVGDLLFSGSIGRTDLPTGNFKLLLQSIKGKILPLGDEVLVIPGHAETTTIVNERDNNPYF